MPQFIFRIDHLDDDELMFFGWQKVARGDEFSLFVRLHDGQEQVISNDPPRWFIADDYNDAVAMSDGQIIEGPRRRH